MYILSMKQQQTGQKNIQTPQKSCVFFSTTRLGPESRTRLGPDPIKQLLELKFSASVLVLIRGVIWHQAEGYNFNISQLQNVKSFRRTRIFKPDFTPRKARKSRHSQRLKPVSPVCRYHYSLLILIPLGGTVIDGDMLSIVLQC